VIAIAAFEGEPQGRVKSKGALIAQLAVGGKRRETIVASLGCNPAISLPAQTLAAEPFIEHHLVHVDPALFPGGNDGAYHLFIRHAEVAVTEFVGAFGKEFLLAPGATGDGIYESQQLGSESLSCR